MRKPMLGMAVALLTLALGALSLSAQETKRDRADALAARLGLDDQQKEAIRKICTEFEGKMDPVAQQIWMTKREALGELQNLLNDEQRAKLPEAIKEEKGKALQPIVAKLGLSDEQKQQVEKTWAEFGNKFQELVAQKPEDAQKQFQQLRHELCAAIAGQLTDEQQIRLPAVLREEFHQWRQPAFRREHIQAIESRLSLNAEQKEAADKILAQCEEKTEKPMAQIKQLHQEEHAAIEKVLNEEQRTRLSQIMKSRGRDQ